MNLLSLLSLSVLIVILSAGAKATEEHDTTNLYPDKGPVLNFEKDTFYSKLSNSDRSWLVLFYLSWCGHCIDYVPTYVSVARNLNGWSKLVRVSAVNCAQDDKKDLCRVHNITGYPTLMYMPAHTKDTKLGLKLDEEVTQSNSTVLKYVMFKIKEANPEATSSVPSLQPTTMPDSKPVARLSKDLVITSQNSSMLFYGDLVYALRYSLDSEVGGQPVIQGGALTALKKFLATLQKYFPDNKQEVTDAIASLHTLLQQKESTSISHDIWNSLLKESGLLKAAGNHAKLVRCKGSETKYRGYPCSLWSLFHTLTVHSAVFANKEREDKHLHDKGGCYDTLTTMKEYIAHFFLCIDCRGHFSKMAVEVSELKDKPEKECVLWLWRAHNKANKRLHGAASEDPSHPKIQFPSKELCPLCRNPKGMWDEEVVYDMLHSIYTAIKEDVSEQPNLIAMRPIASVRSYHPRGVGIGTLEVSTCYMIYAVCAVVIAILFYVLVIRKRLFLRARKGLKMSDKYEPHKPIY